MHPLFKGLNTSSHEVVISCIGLQFEWGPVLSSSNYFHVLFSVRQIVYSRDLLALFPKKKEKKRRWKKKNLSENNSMRAVKVNRNSKVAGQTAR